MMKYSAGIILLFLCLTAFARPNVIVLPYSGPIGPVAQLQLERAIADGVKSQSEAIIVELDTPGGLLSTTRSMVQTILNSPLPIIVYVSPRGAHAGSAGVFLTLAGNIAAMAPGTNIGAAHPVNLGGSGSRDSLSGVMEEKVLNDAAAQIRTIASQRGRNIEWAEKAVRKSVSITETEAESLKVIDFVAQNRDDLLEKCEGRVVRLANGSIRTLHTHSVEVRLREPGIGDKTLQLIAEPNVSYILMTLGFFGLLFEFQNPGAIWPGVMGGLCMLLAFTAFQVLPINFAGFALIVIGFVLFLLEIKIVSKGAFTVGGIIALVTGSLMLFDLPDDVPGLNWSVITGVTLATVLFFAFAVSAGIKALKRRVVTGQEAMIGECAEVVAELNPTGKVFVRGELWQATATVAIPVKSLVEIEKIEGTLLHVRLK